MTPGITAARLAAPGSAGPFAAGKSAARFAAGKRAGCFAAAPIAAACALLYAWPARANPLELLGFTPRAAAMAGAQAGLADDLGAAFYNPAGMLGHGKTELGLGLGILLPALHVDRALTTSAVKSAEPEASARLELGAVIPVGGFFKDHLYIGFAVGVPTAKLLRLENLDPSRPQFLLWQSKPQRFSITFDAAVRLAPGLSLGGGMQIAQQQRGYYHFGLDVADRLVSVRESHVDAVVAPVPVLGVVWEPGAGWRVGLVWRGEQAQTTDVPTTFDLGALGSLQIQTSSSTFYWPHTIALGASAHPAAFSGALLVAAQLELQLWSHAPSDEVQFAILPTGEVLTNLGFSGLLGFSAPARSAGLQSILIPRVGAELQVSPAVALRAGITLKPAVTPEQSGTTNYLDNFTTTLCGGVGLRLPPLGEVLPEPLLVDLAAQVSVLAERKLRKSSAADPTGDSSFGGAVWGLSAMVRYAY